MARIEGLICTGEAPLGEKITLFTGCRQVVLPCLGFGKNKSNLRIA
ncbi:hypothetical protein HP436_11345 [Pseudomonas sp. CrR14]|jgi:hypothetical protein|nr:hypothetical protein [Pseudomonas sp. CrR14]